MGDIGVLTAIVGFVEFIKACDAGDWKTAKIIFGAALVGGICGYIGLENLTVISGIQLGLSASGSLKGLSYIGRGVQNVATEKSTVTQTHITESELVQPVSK